MHAPHSVLIDYETNVILEFAVVRFHKSSLNFRVRMLSLFTELYSAYGTEDMIMCNTNACSRFADHFALYVLLQAPFRSRWKVWNYVEEIILREII